MDNNGSTEGESPAVEEEERIISNEEIQRLQEYLPLIELMIKKISEQPGTPREAQLKKLKHLRELFLDTKKQFKVGTARKCEMVLMNFKKIFKEGTMASKFPPPVFTEDSNSRSSNFEDRDLRQEPSNKSENQLRTSKREDKLESVHKSSVRDDNMKTKKTENSSSKKSHSYDIEFLKNRGENHKSVEESRNFLSEERKSSNRETFQSRLDKRFVFGRKVSERNSTDNNSNIFSMADDSHDDFPAANNSQTKFPIVSNNHGKFTEFASEKSRVDILEPEIPLLHDELSSQSRWSERTSSTEDMCEDNSRSSFERSPEKKESSRKTMIRDMLAKQIDVVHKVGESKGGALRALIHKEGDMKSPPRLDLSNKDKSTNPLLMSPTQIINRRLSLTDTDERVVPGTSLDSLNVKKTPSKLFSENRSLKNCENKANVHDQSHIEKQLKDRKDTGLLNNSVKDPRMKETSNGFVNKNSILPIQESRNSFANKFNLNIKKAGEPRRSSYSDVNDKRPTMTSRDPRLNSGSATSKRPETPYPTSGKLVCPPPPKITAECPPPPEISRDTAELVKKASNILNDTPMEDIQRILRENNIQDMVKSSNVSLMQHSSRESVSASQKGSSMYSLINNHLPSRNTDIHATRMGHNSQNSSSVVKNDESTSIYSRGIKPDTYNKPSLLPFPFPQNQDMGTSSTMYNMPNADFASHLSPAKQLKPGQSINQTNVLPSPNTDFINMPQSPSITSPVAQPHMSPAYQTLLSPTPRSSQPALLPTPSSILDVQTSQFQVDSNSQLRFQQGRYAPVHYDYNHSHNSQLGRSSTSWNNNNQQRTFPDTPESPPSVNWPVTQNPMGYMPQAHRNISDRDPRANDISRRSFEMSGNENGRDLDWCPPSPFETGDPNFRPKTPVANREFSRPKTPINREFNRPKTPIDNREFFRTGTTVDNRDFRSKTPADNNMNFRSKTPVDNTNFRSKTPISNRDFRSNMQNDNRNFRPKPPTDREFSRPKTPAGRQEFSRPRTPYVPFRRGVNEREQSNKNIDQKGKGHKGESEIRSPLCSLYGTVTIPKTGKGYGFQNFRIPKKPRPQELEEKQQVDTLIKEKEKSVTEEVHKKEAPEPSVKQVEILHLKEPAKPVTTELSKEKETKYDSKNSSDTKRGLDKKSVPRISNTGTDLAKTSVSSTLNSKTELAKTTVTSISDPDVVKSSVEKSTILQPDISKTSLSNLPAVQPDLTDTVVSSSSNIQPDLPKTPIPSTSDIIQPDLAKELLEVLLKKSLEIEGGRLFEKFLPKNYKIIKKESDSDSEDSDASRKSKHSNRKKKTKHRKKSSSEDESDSSKEERRRKSTSLAQKKEHFKRNKSKVIVSSDDESESSKEVKSKKAVPVADESELPRKHKNKKLHVSDEESESSKMSDCKKSIVSEDESESFRKSKSKKYIVSEDEAESFRKSKSKKSIVSEDESESFKKSKNKKFVASESGSKLITKLRNKKSVESQNNFDYNKVVIKQEILSEPESEVEERRRESSDESSDVPLAFISSSPTKNLNKKGNEESVKYRPGPKSKKKNLKVINTSSSAYNTDTDDLRNENYSNPDVKSKHSKHKKSKKFQKIRDGDKEKDDSVDVKRANKSYDSVYDFKELSNDDEQFSKLSNSESGGSSPRKSLKRRDPVARLHEDAFNFPFSDTNLLGQRSCRSKVAYDENMDDDDSLLSEIQSKDDKVVPNLDKKREFSERGKNKRGGRRRRSKKSDDSFFRNNAEAVAYLHKVRRQLYRNPTKELQDFVYEKVQELMGQTYIQDFETKEIIFTYSRKAKRKKSNAKLINEIEKLYTSKNITLSGNMLQDILSRYATSKNKKKVKTKKNKNSSFNAPVCVKTEPPETFDEVKVKVERMSPTNIDTESASSNVESSYTTNSDGLIDSQSQESDKNVPNVDLDKTREVESKVSSQSSNDAVGADDDGADIPVTTFEFESEVEIKCNTPVPEECSATPVPEEHCVMQVSEDCQDTLASEVLHDIPVLENTSVPSDSPKEPLLDEHCKTVRDEHHKTPVFENGHNIPLIDGLNTSGAEKISDTPVSENSQNALVSEECSKIPDSEETHEESISEGRHNEQLGSVELPPIKIVRKCVKYEMKGKSKKRKTKWQYGILKKKSSKAKTDIPYDSETLASKAITDFAKDGECIGEDNSDLMLLQNQNNVNTLRNKSDLPPNYFADKSYAQIDNQAVPCKLCNFNGARIVKHYKVSHPGAEVSISRFERKQAENILKEAKKFNFMSNYNSDEMIALSLSLKDLLTPAFQCRLCKFKCNTFSMFFDHITIHTGEYRYGCNLCDYLSGFRKSVKTHLQSHHSGVREMGKNVSILYELPVVPSDCCLLIAHMCSACNFVQLQKENVKRHISKMHDGSSEAEIVCVNMVNNTHLSALAETFDASEVKLNRDENENSSDSSEDDIYRFSENDENSQDTIKTCDMMKLTKQLFVAVKPLSLSLIREKLRLNDEKLEVEGDSENSKTENGPRNGASPQTSDYPEKANDSSLRLVTDTDPGSVSKDVSNDLELFTGPAPLSVKLKEQRKTSALLELQVQSSCSQTNDMPEKGVTNLSAEVMKETTAEKDSEPENANKVTDVENMQERIETEQTNEKERPQEEIKRREIPNLKYYTEEEREKYEREKMERLKQEEKERAEREEKERLEQEEKKRQEIEQRKIRDKEEKEKHEREEKERVEREERERVEREEKEKREKEERERQEKIERERLGKEAKEKAEREERERIEKIEREKKEKEERERREKEEKERREREEKERREREEKERIEREERERLEKIEREKREKEELERLHKVLGTKKTENTPDGDLKIEPFHSLIKESMVATCKVRALFSVSLQFLSTFTDEPGDDTLEWKLKVEKKGNDKTDVKTGDGATDYIDLTEFSEKLFIKDDKTQVFNKDSLNTNENKVENDLSEVSSKVFNPNKMKKVTTLSYNEESNKLNSRMCLLNKQLTSFARSSVYKNQGTVGRDSSYENDTDVSSNSLSRQESAPLLVIDDFVIFVGPLQVKKTNNSSINYLCHVNDCQYVTPYHNEFKKHVLATHRRSMWNGYCYSCGSVNIFSNGNISSSYELHHALRHLFEGHLFPLISRSMSRQQSGAPTGNTDCGAVVDVPSSESSVDANNGAALSQSEMEVVPNSDNIGSTGDDSSATNDAADCFMGLRIENVVSLHPEFENNADGCSNSFLPNDSTDSENPLCTTPTNKQAPPTTETGTVSSITLYPGDSPNTSVEKLTAVKSQESPISKPQSIKFLTPVFSPSTTFPKSSPISILSKQVKGIKNQRTIIQAVSSSLSTPLITNTSPITKLGIMSLKGSDHIARVTVLSTAAVTSGLNSLTKTTPVQTLTPVSSIQNLPLLTSSDGSSIFSFRPHRKIKIVPSLKPVDHGILPLSPKKTTIVALRNPKSNELRLVSPKKGHLTTVPQFKKLLPKPVIIAQSPPQNINKLLSMQPSIKLPDNENDISMNVNQEKNNALQLVSVDSADSQKSFSGAFYQLKRIVNERCPAVFAWKTTSLCVYTVCIPPNMLPNKTPKASTLNNCRSVGDTAIDKFFSNIESNSNATSSVTEHSDASTASVKIPELTLSTEKQTETVSSVVCQADAQAEPAVLANKSSILQKDSENQKSTFQIEAMNISDQSSTLEKDSELSMQPEVSQAEAVNNASFVKSSNSQPNELTGNSFISSLLKTGDQDLNMCDSSFSDVFSTTPAVCTSSSSLLVTLLNNPVTVSTPTDNTQTVTQSVMTRSDLMPIVSSTNVPTTCTASVSSASNTDMPATSTTDVAVVSNTDKATTSNANNEHVTKPNTEISDTLNMETSSNNANQEDDISEIPECDISSENFSIQISKINSKTFDFIIPSLNSSDTLSDAASSDGVLVDNNKTDSLSSSPTKATRSFSSPSSNYMFFKGHFLHKCLVSPIIVKHTKGIFAFRGMTVASKLVHLYKCMSRFCTFSTNSESDFLKHFHDHSLIKVDEDSLDFQRCPYCCTVHPTASSYMDHIKTEHGHSNYQCLYCFFRAASQCFVLLHQNTHHKAERAAVLFCPSTSPPPLPESITCLYDDAPAYKCIEGTCDLGFFEWDTFLTHLKECHSDAESYQCHICKEKLTSLDALNKHCSKRYHCLYCKKCASLENEIHCHLYRRHPNQRCRAVERIKRDSDVGGECLSSVTFHKGVSFSDSIVFPAEEFSEPAVKNPEVTEDNNGCTMELDVPVDKANSAAKQDSNVSKELTNQPEDSTGRTNNGTAEKEQVTSDVNKDNNDSTNSSKDNAESKGTESSGVKTPTLIDLTIDSDDDSDVEIISCEIFKKYNEIIDLSDDDDKSFVLEKENKVSINKDLSDVNDQSKAHCSGLAFGEDENIDIVGENSEDSRMTTDTTSEKIDDTDHTFSFQKFSKTTELSGSDLYICGNTDCTYKTHASSFFKNHSLICDFGRHTKGFVCAHCKKSCKNLKTLLDHLMIHGVKRYLCDMCDYKAPKFQFAIRHLKKKHKVTDPVVKAKDPFQTNPDTAVFTVYSKSRGILKKAVDTERASVERTSVDMDEPEVIVIDDNDQLPELTDKEEKPPVEEKTLKYGPEDIENLPDVPIFTSIVTCAVCSFTTSVQKNFIRHLKMHRQTVENDNDLDLPCEQPVNPVPCLNNIEMMFDKMTNLAASSHYGGSLAAFKRPQDYLPSPEEKEFIPKYIPPNKRYVCRLDGCDYLSCDQLLLKYHVRALHFNSSEYTCPHCPAHDVNATMPIDKMAIHLKMHGGRLYKCVYCAYCHYQRHTLEKHVTDKHVGQLCAVFIVRDSEDSDQEPPPVSKVIIVNKEVVEKKSEKASKSATWMCGFCDVRCNTRGEIIEHAASKHGQRSQYRCCHCSYKSSAILSMATHFSLKHPGKDPEFLHAYRKLPPGSQREAVPQPAATSSTADNVPAQESAPLQTVPQTAKPSPAVASPLWSRSIRKGCLRSIRGILIEESDTAVGPNKESLEDVIKKFGPLGSPSGDKKYLCPLCRKHKTPTAQDLKFHLYMELKYKKWGCGHCGMTSFFRAELERHSVMIREKEGKKIEVHQLPPDEGIELWVDNVIEHQLSLIKTLKQSSPPVLSPQKSPVKASTELTLSIPPSPKTPEVTASVMEVNAESTPNITEPEMPALNVADSSASTITTSPESVSGQDQPPIKQYSCRSCPAMFSSTRGLKQHVRINHLKLAKWQCAYCDLVSNTESAVLNHCKRTHQYLHPRAVVNEKYDAFKIDPKFWTKYYGQDFEKESPKFTKVKTEAGKYRKVEVKKPRKVGLPNAAKSKNVTKPASCETVKRKLDESNSFSDETLPPVTPNKVQKTNVAMEHCDYCDFIGNLNNHLANHGVMRIFNCLCLGCVVYTDSQSSIDQHLADAHKSVPFYCWKFIEKEPSATRKRQLDSLDGSVSSKNKMCYYCNKTVHESQIITHCRQNHGRDVPRSAFFMCPQCMFETVELQTAREHIKTKHLKAVEIQEINSCLNAENKNESPYDRGERCTYSCTLCVFRTDNLEDLIQHLKKCHNADFACEVCFKTYNSHEDATDHFRSEHSREWLKIIDLRYFDTTNKSDEQAPPKENYRMPQKRALFGDSFDSNTKGNSSAKVHFAKKSTAGIKAIGTLSLIETPSPGYSNINLANDNPATCMLARKSTSGSNMFGHPVPSGMLSPSYSDTNNSVFDTLKTNSVAKKSTSGLRTFGLNVQTGMLSPSHADANTVIDDTASGIQNSYSLFQKSLSDLGKIPQNTVHSNSSSNIDEEYSKQNVNESDNSNYTLEETLNVNPQVRNSVAKKSTSKSIFRSLPVARKSTSIMPFKDFNKLQSEPTIYYSPSGLSPNESNSENISVSKDVDTENISGAAKKSTGGVTLTLSKRNKRSRSGSSFFDKEEEDSVSDRYYDKSCVQDESGRLILKLSVRNNKITNKSKVKSKKVKKKKCESPLSGKELSSGSKIWPFKRKIFKGRKTNVKDLLFEGVSGFVKVSDMMKSFNMSPRVELKRDDSTKC